MKPEIFLNSRVHWKYQTDDKFGICVIAKDKMTINFKFECFTKNVYDVLKIDYEIDNLLNDPVSVEGALEHMKSLLPDMKITVRGRAESHGWIEASI